MILLNLPHNQFYRIPRFFFPGHDLGDLGVELHDVDLLPGVFSLYIGGNGEIVFLPGDLLISGQMGEVDLLGTVDKGVHNAVDVLRRQLIVVGHLDALFGGVNKQSLVVHFVLFQHHDAGGDTGAEKQIAGQLDHAVDEVVVDEILADLLLRPAPVHNAGEADDGGGTIGRQPTEAVHDKGKICLALGGQHTSRGKTGVVDEQRVIVPGPLDGVGRIGNNQFKGLVVPVLRVGQGILTSDIKLVKADVVEEHIDAAQVVGGDVDLPNKAGC